MFIKSAEKTNQLDIVKNAAKKSLVNGEENFVVLLVLQSITMSIGINLFTRKLLMRLEKKKTINKKTNCVTQSKIIIKFDG